MQTFSDLGQLPWYVQVDNLAPVSPVLKEMFMQLLVNGKELKQNEFSQLFQIPMGHEWFLEVLHQNDQVKLLPSKFCDGIVQSRETTKEDVMVALFDNLGAIGRLILMSSK